MPNRTPHPRKVRRHTGWWVGGFLFGFGVGLALSLWYGWVLDPRPLPITPSDLRAEAKADYVRLIALAYVHDQNAIRAIYRLNSLQESNFNALVIAVTEQQIAQTRERRETLALIGLTEAVAELSPQMVAYRSAPATLPPSPTANATVLPAFTDTPTASITPTEIPPTSTFMPTSPNIVTATATSTLSATLIPSPTVMPSVTVTSTASISSSEQITQTVTATGTQQATRRSPLTVTPTRTRIPTPTSRPTRTPTPDPNAPFRVIASAIECDVTAEGLLQIYVRGRDGQGRAGETIRVMWPNGEDRLFTGFKPEIDTGYADFEMTLGRLYQVSLTDYEIDGRVPEITLDPDYRCPDLVPTWRVVLQQR